MINIYENMYVNPAHIIAMYFDPIYSFGPSSERPAMIVHVRDFDKPFIIYTTLDGRPMDVENFRWFVGLVTRGIKK